MGYLLAVSAILLLALILAFALFRRRDSQPGAAALHAPDGSSQTVPGRKWPEGDTILKVVGVLATLLTIVIGLFEFNSNQRERTANEVRAEYIHATQLLTESDPSRSIAGIIAMSQLAEDSTERTWQMTESLSAFIRYKAPRLAGPQLPDETGPYTPCNSRDQEKNVDRPCTFLYVSNPLIQIALNALAYRNQQNETFANVPIRMRPRLKATNPVPEPNSQEAHDWVRHSINHEWLRTAPRSKAQDRELINEIQYPVGRGFPAVMRRPWLDLAHTNLTGVELRGAFFEGGDFHEADISFSYLSSTSFAEANLKESQIHRAHLFGADLRGANLERVDMQATELGRSDLRDTWMSGGRFSWSNFWEANLTGAYLVAADMTNLETMGGARLDNVVAFRADFSKSAVAGNDASEIVCMQHAFLKQARMRETDLRGVDLRSSELQGADLSHARLRGADLRGTNLDGANIDGADLSDADLRGVDLTNTIGTPSRVTGAKVNNATKLVLSWPTALAKQVILRPESLDADEQCTTRERNDAERSALVEDQSPIVK
jgi:uncharacterized protein YjbI with pentapeptide repeats